MDDEVTIQRETLQVLVDTIAGSMDYGSGFLDIEDVQALWAAAEILGIPQIDVTPSEFRHLMPHRFILAMPPWRGGVCYTCGKGEDFECHEGL